MEEKKEVQSELCKKVEGFAKELETVFPKEDSGHKAVLIVAIDEDADDEHVIIEGIIRGKGSVLCRGIAGAMRNNKDLEKIMEDSVEFYHFLNNPIKTLKEMLNDL